MPGHEQARGDLVTSTDPVPTDSRPSRRGRRFALAMAVAIVVIVGILNWYRSSLRPTDAAEAVVTVPEGATTGQIARKLKAKNLIRSERAFGWYVRLHGLAPDFNSGRFLVSGEKSTGEVARTLTGRPNAGNQFTIPEGFTQFSIGQRLGRLGIADAKEFQDLKAADFPEYDFLRDLPEGAGLDGYLFPETYSISHAGTSAHDAATIMLDQFQQEIAPLQSKIAASGHSLHEIITVASLVEEEVKTERDRRLVAGIIYNRLDQGIRLDIDATVRYALDKPTGALTAADLDTDNPYNTRKLKGLPPGPIANPGLAAIEAALDPESSEYLFYLSAADGTTYYAKTDADHERNKEKYLQ
jgi:peptidoglycan lytic transglycosylase G